MKKLLLGTLTTISLVFAVPAHAGASANEKASCLGLALSDHAPAGEMPEEAFTAKAAAAELGVPFGALVSGAAHLHPGSHAACEAG